MLLVKMKKLEHGKPVFVPNRHLAFDGILGRAEQQPRRKQPKRPSILARNNDGAAKSKSNGGRTRKREFSGWKS